MTQPSDEVKAPERMWLQRPDSDCGCHPDSEGTLLVERVHTSDVEYIRADLARPVSPDAAATVSREVLNQLVDEAYWRGRRVEKQAQEASVSTSPDAAKAAADEIEALLVPLSDYSKGKTPTISTIAAIITKHCGSTPSVADEHHTMDELYEHRHALFIALMKSHRNLAWCSQQHSDGAMYDGWFIAGMDLPTGPISYHLPLSYFSELDDIAILERAPEWDGYTPADVVARLSQWEPAPSVADADVAKFGNYLLSLRSQMPFNQWQELFAEANIMLQHLNRRPSVADAIKVTQEMRDEWRRAGYDYKGEGVKADVKSRHYYHAANEIITAIKALSVAQPVVPSGWQPIKTAPKETWILIGDHLNGEWRCGMSGRFLSDGVNTPDEYEPSGWFWAEDYISIEEPTYWMPLPAPPATPLPAESPRCPKCGFVMCQQFDTTPINERAELATPNGTYICYTCGRTQGGNDGE